MFAGQNFFANATDATPRRVFDPPPFFQLHSSFIPSTEDEVTIMHAITQIRSAIDLVDEEIYRLNSALAKLQGYRADLFTCVQQHRVVLSPMRRLPTEILGEIFLFATYGHSVQWPFPPEGRNSMPWVLGQVCSYWRTVALSLPPLWSEIHLDLTPVEETPERNFDGLSQVQAAQFLDDVAVKREKLMVAMFETCLHRSKKEPLTFAFKSVSGNPSPYIAQIICSLVKHAERWMDINITWEALNAYRKDLEPVKNRLLNLTRLDVGIASNIFYFEPTRPVDIFQQAPKLRQLTLTAIAEPLQSLLIPWSQITSLATKACLSQEGEFTQMMHSAVNLESLTTEHERILEVASSSPVHLPRLQRLNIVAKGSYIPKVFQFLTMPNLRELSIQALTPFLADLTLPMLVRSRCNPTQLSFLSSLSVDGSWEENISVVKLLSALSSVTDLRLVVLKSGDQLMPRLQYNRQGPPSVLPNLRRIEVEDRLCTSANRVVDTLSSRLEGHDTARWGHWPSGQPGLESIVLSLWRPHASEYTELDQLKGAADKLGIDLLVSIR
ncbi:hypothetical protein CPB84DRAFT_1781199 [Gymnopilus junonius]|uniref:F-box domain-containing protein n=1 Tax=Gymnopilus junonius TaxID=109634 RepID=A0A9P5TLF4_GYMJU|nr:hypothetical protein CPB84DRAFT_1781199 [Gymnopilus junonius]